MSRIHIAPSEGRGNRCRGQINLYPDPIHASRQHYRGGRDRATILHWHTGARGERVPGSKRRRRVVEPAGSWGGERHFAVWDRPEGSELADRGGRPDHRAGRSGDVRVNLHVYDRQEGRRGGREAVQVKVSPEVYAGQLGSKREREVVGHDAGYAGWAEARERGILVYDGCNECRGCRVRGL